MNIYLDVCCLNRPFDEQSQARVRLETEAVLLIMGIVNDREWQWISSEAVVSEVARISDPRRRTRVKRLLTLASAHISITNIEATRARQLQAVGFRLFDALHLACAESGEVDVFLTTDDKLLNLATRLAVQLHVQVANPLPWLESVRR